MSLVQLVRIVVGLIPQLVQLNWFKSRHLKIQYLSCTPLTYLKLPTVGSIGTIARDTAIQSSNV